MAKVSIAVPAYHGEAGMVRLLESIRKQDYKDYEVVITDDSEDDRVGRLAEGQENIRYFKNKVRLGASANWNQAMRRCSGEYIKIMHHDDWFTAPDSLGEFVRMMEEHPEADLVFSGTRQVGQETEYERFTTPEDAEQIRQDYRNLYLGNTIGAPSAVMHRQGVGEYDEALTWLVDLEFYMNVLKKNPHFAYTEKPLVSIGISEAQLTERCIGNREINITEYGYIYRKYGLEGEKKYKGKLMRVLMDYDAAYGEALEYGITKAEYLAGKAGKLAGKVKWKLGIRS
jgi:Glycosyltransferases involved in cell wall biogenesis